MGAKAAILFGSAYQIPSRSFRITGNKMWISGGEHELGENIVHLVLARIPGSPPGAKGISLFLVPRVLPSGELLFFSAIDEGMVLTIAQPHDLVGHLSAELQSLREPADPVAVLAFDCILRRIEAQERQMTGRVSELLRQHRVIGFSTYGEQIGPMHINHTMTGFAFYPPGTVV